MQLIVSEDLKFLRISKSTEEELEQITYSLNRRIRGWMWNPLVKKKLWTGHVPFCKNNLIPIGLWAEVIKIGETYNIDIDIQGLDKIIDQNFDEARFRQWVTDFFSDHPKYTPRDYQIDSAVHILKNRLCVSEIATSAGKTLITFLVFGYLNSIGIMKKMLIVVPNTTLVMQLKDDWEEYNNEKFSNLKIRQVYGGAKDNDPAANVIVGTYQSLSKKPLDFFKDMNVVFCDESHTAQTTSVKTIFKNAKDSIYRFGLSGTLKEDQSADFTTITALIGPIVNSIPAKFLFEGGFATPVKFKVLVLNYKNEDLKRKLYDVRRNKEIEGSKVLMLEKGVVIQHKARFNFIINLIKKTSKNSLVLFSNIKDKYGRRIYEALKDQTDKVCYYVDGSVNQDHRDFFKKEMEEGENRILVASFQCFSTGISIKNIHNIIFVESFKSEVIIKQSIGRGMRQLTDKDSFTVIDIVDDLSYDKHKNYLYKHGEARLDMYKKYTDDITIHKISI